MIGIGSDHLGVVLKQHLTLFLTEHGESVHDFGTFCADAVDYPDIAERVVSALQAGSIERGILICGTGLGMAIAANKAPGVFATPAFNPYMARLARQSNNAQVLTLGANIVGIGLACATVEAWLTAEFQGGDSARKLEKIRNLEDRYQRNAR